jgi:hypothetical protein
VAASDNTLGRKLFLPAGRCQYVCYTIRNTPQSTITYHRTPRTRLFLAHVDETDHPTRWISLSPGLREADKPEEAWVHGSSTSRSEVGLFKVRRADVHRERLRLER